MGVAYFIKVIITTFKDQNCDPHFNATHYFLINPNLHFIKRNNYFTKSFPSHRDHQKLNISPKLYLIIVKLHTVKFQNLKKK